MKKERVMRRTLRNSRPLTLFLFGAVAFAAVRFARRAAAAAAKRRHYDPQQPFTPPLVGCPALYSGRSIKSRQCRRPAMSRRRCHSQLLTVGSVVVAELQSDLRAWARRTARPTAAGRGLGARFPRARKSAVFRSPLTSERVCRQDELVPANTIGIQRSSMLVSG